MKKSYHSLAFKAFMASCLMLLYGACGNRTEKELTFFGGKVKNPKDDYVYVTRGHKVIDSAKLDAHNKFKFALDSIQEGLYTFKHGPEFQYLYLSPQDSLMIYLNTWDFDESLVFSGKGSGKNNFLINLFLQQERIRKDFEFNYEKDEEEFLSLLAQNREKLHKDYENFLAQETEAPSEQFEQLIEIGIDYPLYYLQEVYPYYHMWMKKMKALPDLKGDYYAFRDNIDPNVEGLMYYSPYAEYIRIFTRALAHKEKYESEGFYNLELGVMRHIDQQVDLESFKNNMLAYSAWRSLSYEYLSDKDYQEIHEFLDQKCSDQQIKDEFDLAYKQKSLLKQGDQFPKMCISDMKGKEVSIHKVSNGEQASVIYFWPKDLTKVEILKEKLSKFQKEFPDVVFIGIERNREKEDWKDFVSQQELEGDQQYHLAKSCDNYAWFEGDMSRTIILSDQGKVQYSYLFFTEPSFDEHIYKLKKQHN